jgi:alanine dehydrogenase
MRIIDDETVQAVLPLTACIDAMEDAYKGLARADGSVVNHPRQRYKIAQPSNDRGSYMANIIPGAIASMGVAALRYDSTIVEQQPQPDGAIRQVHLYPHRRSWGFVLLFSIETGEPLACIQDFSLSALRVGATTGVAVRALARKNATSVALFGSGNEATLNLQGICAVRDIRSVKVYSPNREHREAFARSMTDELGIEVLPSNSPADALHCADIIMCATNSNQPVFDGSTLRPGQLVCSIANSDQTHRRDEVDSATFISSNRVVVSDVQTIFNNNQRELLDLLEDGRVDKGNVVELGDILIGKSPGRTGDRDLLYYKANTGMGVQFAAVGALVYQECEKRQLGHVVPTEWFGSDVGGWLDRGFLPSP